MYISKRIFVFFFLALLFFCATAWVLLASAVFGSLRISIAEAKLSDLLRRPVEISGDVSLTFSGGMAVSVTGLQLPSEEMPEQDLATLETARFPIALLHHLRGGIPLPEIEAHGLTVTLLRTEDGKTSWAEARLPEAESEPDSNDVDVFTFLGARTVSFSDMVAHSENQSTGFEFDLELNDFTVRQVTDAERPTVRVRSQGLINGEPAEFRGDFPDGAPFDASGQLGALVFDISGQSRQDLLPGEFDGTLNIETPDLQNLLDTLRLDGKAAGSARATSSIKRRDRLFLLEDIDLSADFENGMKALLTGALADPRAGPEFDLLFELDLAQQVSAAKSAIFLRDIEPTRISTHSVGKDGIIEVKSFKFETNAFDEELKEIGPFRVERVMRTSDGQLKVSGLTLTIGPEDAPMLAARGDIADLINFKGYTLSGRLDLPASRVLLTLREEDAARFGHLTGSFRLEEQEGKGVLSTSDLATRDTDLWEARIGVNVGDIAALDAMRFEIHLSTPDGASFLRAVQLDPVETGRFGYDLTAERRNQRLSVSSTVSAGESSLDADLKLHVAGGKPMLRGAVTSETVRLVDVRNAILAATELARAKSVYREARLAEAESRGEYPEEEFQPLVLPPEDSDGEDLSDFQPLVLPETLEAESEDPQAQVSGDEDLSGYQPLVIFEGAGSLSLEDLRDPEKFVPLIDAEISIGIERITGQKGVSAIKSKVDMKDGKLRFGPLRVNYGGGYADLQAAFDAVRSPGWVQVSGRTGGWDLGRLLDSLGAGIGAYGILTGQFNLTGRRTSVRAFLDSMSGQTTVEMKNGRISSSLIDLAGLGVLPWLFSAERRGGYADIVCLRAPLKISRGRVSTGAAVVETRRVQLVGAGSVDFKRDRIFLRADPRPVGRPLARSAWPFEVSGPLGAPKVKLAKRRSWSAAEPLAMTANRVPCVPDVKQLKAVPRQPRNPGPR
ncbi:AsmA-like C-terminal region-containing protein [Defluviimonas sp. D31]|uniref:AsmA-like C-terminal region-containing protein n=1 Tax=Defluviimonas sp. D31 TaxID=3083253 RepID=UPI00296E8B79|nr:AsmA-like C-terminal region-containing protein [Defluviimonas sp. D31]MDW4551444.1 AsmA-like C-terminal region-containing protein [Defluviimonas sp. D31]